ncbi:hypothetical protein BH23VER1_BH23VER1_31710 [soil metagenome]
MKMPFRSRSPRGGDDEGAVLGSAARWRERWARLCDWLALGVPALAAGDRLLAHYSEAGRYYHTPDHVLRCLEALDRYPAAIDDPDAVELAIWYHDSVYVVGAGPGENEAASARLFRAEFLPVASERVNGERVERYILATCHHGAPDDADSGLVMDIDLAVLGEESPRYQQYASDIRREYARIPEPDYRSGRAEVLKGILGRRSIYTTNHFRKLYEERARANLVAELDRLAGRAGA